jgi:hypothetical protein
MDGEGSIIEESVPASINNFSVMVDKNEIVGRD